MSKKVEGVTRAEYRLWESDLAHKFDDLMVGQKVRVHAGPFVNRVMRVVGLVREGRSRFIYCNGAD